MLNIAMYAIIQAESNIRTRYTNITVNYVIQADLSYHHKLVLSVISGFEFGCGHAAICCNAHNTWQLAEN